MKEISHLFYSLKCKGGNLYHKNGQTIIVKERLLIIGETRDSDIRYESNDFKPEYYASIVRNEDGVSWRIVKRLQQIDIKLIGYGSIGYAHQLVDGDIIQFGEHGMTLQFNIHNDHSNFWKKHRTAVVALTILLFSAIFWGSKNIWRDSQDLPITEEDVAEFESSVYQIKVDSVQWVKHPLIGVDSVLASKAFLNDAPSGTAFLTKEGVIVTARHCVEYWLGEYVDLTQPVKTMSKNDIITWAIETETYNQEHAMQNDTTMQLRAFFSIYNFLGTHLRSLVSTDSCVHFNTSHDGIFMMADFEKDYYLRSIQPYFMDKTMMLGDILWIGECVDTGNIRLATEKELSSLKRGSNLMVCGYPITGIGEKQMVTSNGKIKRRISPDVENLCIESNINHGYSGGPVFAKINNEIVVVGVISRVDSVSNGIEKWAVPITQITNENVYDE